MKFMSFLARFLYFTFYFLFLNLFVCFVYWDENLKGSSQAIRRRGLLCFGCV